MPPIEGGVAVLFGVKIDFFFSKPISSDLTGMTRSALRILSCVFFSRFTVHELGTVHENSGKGRDSHSSREINNSIPGIELCAAVACAHILHFFLHATQASVESHSRCADVR